MWKKILIGTLVTILVLAVLGGVAAVSFGVGSRMGIAQARLSAPAVSPNGSNVPQVTPPRLRGPNGNNGNGNNGKVQPSNPRSFAQPFGRGNFQPNAGMTIRRAPFGGNIFGAAFGFLIPLLVIVVLVLVIIRLARGGLGGFWHYRMPPPPPGAGGNVMYMRGGPNGPEPFTVPLGTEAPKADEEKKD